MLKRNPYQVARLLIDATANMIHLRMHQEELNQEVDSPEIWYERLHELDSNYANVHEKTLVHTLTFACEAGLRKIT